MVVAGKVLVRVEGGVGMVKRGKILNPVVREFIGEGAIIRPEDYARDDPGLEKALANLQKEIDRSFQTKVVKTSKKGDPVEVSTKPVNKKSGKIITVKHLAMEFKIEPSQVRRRLRAKYGRNEGRWEWDADDPKLKEIRKLFS